MEATLHMNRIVLLLLICLSGCYENDSSNKDFILINDQQDLVDFLSGSEYLSDEEYITGEICNENKEGNYDCKLVYGNWKLEFADSELIWSIHDQLEIATYKYVNSTEFLINLSHTSIIATIDMSAQTVKAEDVTYSINNTE